MKYLDLAWLRGFLRAYPFMLPILALSAAGGVTGIVICSIWLWGEVTRSNPAPTPLSVARQPARSPEPAQPPRIIPTSPPTPPVPKPQPNLQMPPNDPAADVADVADVDRGLIVGDVYVRLSVVRVGEFDGYGLTENSGRKVLFVELEVKNLSDTKKLDFDGWNGFIDHPKLQDEHGNKYDFISAVGILTATKTAPKQIIYPGKTATDSLRFPLPVERAKELRLTLPRDPIQQGGVLKFRIPVEAIQKPVTPN